MRKQVFWFSVTSLIRQNRVYLIAVIGLVLVSSLGIPVDSADLERPRIKRFRVNRSDNQFEVSGELFPAFQSDIDASILAGTPTTFKYDIYLKRVRWYWDNEILAHESYLYTVVYDTLRECYTVTVTGKDGQQKSIQETKSRQTMQNLMTHFSGVLIYSDENLSDDDVYYVSMTATLTTRKLPSPWNELLFFLSNDFRTETSRKFFPEH